MSEPAQQTAGEALAWTEELAQLRRRAQALRAAGLMPDPMRRADGEVAYARLREVARALFEAAIEALRDFCPPGYPWIDDNGILGTGGAIGLRLSDHHSFFVSFEHVKRKKKREPEEPQGLAGALGLVPKKRMPGDALPPADPNEPVRLAMQTLRWDEHSGWSEIHRVLDPRWDERLLREQLLACLVGFVYDATLGQPPAMLESEMDRDPARIGAVAVAGQPATG